MYFAEHAKRMRSPVYQRASLPAGFAAQGPAVIEEMSSTTLLAPGQEARVDGIGNLVIEINGGHKP